MDGELLLLGVEGVGLTLEEAGLFKRLQPAGFILFSRNMESPEQVRRLTDQLREVCMDEPIVSIDQEGGRVERTRAFAPSLPSAAAFAANADMEQIARAGQVTADLLRMMGFNLNFAPVLDIEYFPDAQNGLNQRCWGTDSQVVIDRAGMWNRWARKRGMLACGKHFPSCGRARSDPHDELPVSGAGIEEMMKADALPYTALMPELDSVMVGHIRFPNIDEEFPASLSKRIVTGWLREQLGFDRHLVLTDDLDMGAIVNKYGRGEDVKLALSAGNDLAMICHRTDTAVIAAEAIGELSIGLRDDCKERLAKFRKKMVTPLDWSQGSWDKTCAEIGRIAEKIEETGPADERSAVTRY